MEPIRIWFNRNYSTTVHLTNMVRHNADGVPVVVFGSHVDTGSPMLTNCDHRLPEPSRTDADFVDQVLELCSAHRIDVLVPMAGQSLIAHRAAEFAAVGTALICPSASAIDVLADKAATYLALPGNSFVPPWRLVRSLAEFDEAAAELDCEWTTDRPLVLKPTIGVGADGVRFLTRKALGLAGLLGPVTRATDVGTVRTALSDANDIPPLLLMPYLPGPETSVDVLAHRGHTVAAVPRLKIGRQRVIGGDPALLGLTEELVERFDLDGLVNIQFRSFGGRPVLLEINARPSGGLFQTALAGVNLPWAAVQIALGNEPGIVRPRLGAQYVTVPTALPWPSGRQPLPALPAPRSRETLLAAAD